ncbi:MAG: TauD/TfdA family dioxygenase [Acidiferrobacterales bacterium]|nr:TauD/TfdA family dioxygenase [Acidiferrobacterales bacterium]
MSYQNIQCTRRSPHLGAFVDRVDLSTDLGEQTVAEIRSALLEFGVLFFKNQSLSESQHIRLGAQFGELDEPHPVFDCNQDDPRLTIIESKGRAADAEHYWHTDVTYQVAPSMGSILLARKIPESGGDTLFSSMYAAYDTLSEPIKNLLESLTAQHSIERGWGTSLRMKPDGEQEVRKLMDAFPLQTHPRFANPSGDRTHGTLCQ